MYRYYLPWIVPSFLQTPIPLCQGNLKTKTIISRICDGCRSVIITHICSVRLATPSPKKKRKLEKDKKSKGERVMERAVESFVKHKNEMEDTFRK